MTSKLGQTHLKSDRKILFTQHNTKRKKKESGAEQFPMKDSKHMETWHSSERNKICKHAQGKSAGGMERTLRKMK